MKKVGKTTFEYEFTNLQKSQEFQFTNVQPRKQWLKLTYFRQFLIAISASNVISTKILPQLEAFIATNKDKIAASFKLAAEFAVQFLAALIAIGNWVANNTGKVKAIAAAFALMFVVTKVYSMITAINLLTAALVRMNVAMGAGAIGAATKGAAKGGMFATLGVALAGGGVANKIGGGLAGLCRVLQFQGLAARRRRGKKSLRSI